MQNGHPKSESFSRYTSTIPVSVWHFPANALEFRGRESAFGLSLSANPSFATLRRSPTCLSSAQPCSTPHRLSSAILASSRRLTPSLPLATPTPSPSSVLIRLTATGRCASSCPGPRKPASLLHLRPLKALRSPRRKSPTP